MSIDMRWGALHMCFEGIQLQLYFFAEFPFFPMSQDTSTNHFLKWQGSHATSTRFCQAQMQPGSNACLAQACRVSGKRVCQCHAAGGTQASLLGQCQNASIDA